MKLFAIAALLLSLNAFSATSGMKVEEVTPGSAYSQWKLQVGDVIQKINNKEVSSLNDLMKYMGEPKTVKTLNVLRDNKLMELKLN